MLNKENTEQTLEAWGADIVKFARININDRNRKRKSKITGKMRRGKIDSSGDLRKSLDNEFVVNKNSFGFQITGIDYTSDVNSGKKRKTSVSDIKSWMKSKRLRLTNSQGFIKMTPARIQGFAEFVAWKVSTIGSDVTDFMTDAVEMAGKKHRKDLEESMFKDIDQEVGMVLRSLENGSSNI